LDTLDKTLTERIRGTIQKISGLDLILELDFKTQQYPWIMTFSAVCINWKTVPVLFLQLSSTINREWQILGFATFVFSERFVVRFDNLTYKWNKQRFFACIVVLLLECCEWRRTNWTTSLHIYCMRSLYKFPHLQLIMKSLTCERVTCLSWPVYCSTHHEEIKVNGPNAPKLCHKLLGSSGFRKLTCYLVGCYM